MAEATNGLYNGRTYNDRKIAIGAFRLAHYSRMSRTQVLHSVADAASAMKKANSTLAIRGTYKVPERLDCELYERHLLWNLSQNAGVWHRRNPHAALGQTATREIGHFMTHRIADKNLVQLKLGVQPLASKKHS